MNHQFNPAERYESPVLHFSLLTLGILACVVALAVQGTARAGDAYSTKVSIKGLDLSTTEGMRIARERVHQAAHFVCERADDPDDLSHHENYLACVEAATAVAMQQLTPSAAASVAKNSVP